jgi:C1A family cysteine protease
MKTTDQLRPRNIQWYGWKPDLPDYRDYLYASIAKAVQIPKAIDLRKGCPPIYDQGRLGSCTANAIAGAIEFELLKQGSKYDFMPSRLFIYYNERFIEGTVSIDNGAELRSGMKSVNKDGVCPETIWKYSDGKTLFKKKPGTKAYKEALNHQVLSYHRITHNLNQMKGCLAEGYPFVFGFAVYDGFETDSVAESGVVHMPESSEHFIGGHAVMCVGYDDGTQRFVVRNSWGSNWGKSGYFTMPYEYLLNSNLADDFWTIRIMELNASLSDRKSP